MKKTAEGQMHVHSFLRAEAITAMLALVRCEDPLETFDRVQMLHRERYQESTGE